MDKINSSSHKDSENCASFVIHVFTILKLIFTHYITPFFRAKKKRRSRCRGSKSICRKRPIAAEEIGSCQASLSARSNQTGKLCVEAGYSTGATPLSRLPNSTC